MKKETWICLKEFSVGYRISAGLEPSSYNDKQNRKRNEPLSIDLLLVKRDALRTVDDDELQNFADWRTSMWAFKNKYHSPREYPDGLSKEQLVFYELSELLREREVVIVECKTTDTKESSHSKGQRRIENIMYGVPDGKVPFTDEYGPHVLFHGLGQAILYHVLFNDDFGKKVRRIRTAVLTNQGVSVELKAFEKIKSEHLEPSLDFPPFSTILWDTSFADAEFFNKA